MKTLIILSQRNFLLRKLFVLILTFGIPFASYSQVTQEWVSRYNGPGNMEDKAYSIAVDGLGNVYVTGYVFASFSPSLNYDYATIKYNPDGLMQWVSLYNGPGNGVDEASSLAVDDSGNVYVTGTSAGLISNDYATIKYNSLGVEQWVSRYNGPGNPFNEAISIAVDGSGNVYVAGRSMGSGTGWDYATIKYNSSGAEQWVSRYEGLSMNSIDEATSLALDNLGNVYVTGSSRVSGVGHDYATIKYNSDGNQQWVSRYNGPGNGIDIPYAIKVSASGNVYVTGQSFQSGASYDYATIEYNPAGVQQWVSRYNGPGNSEDAARSLDLDDSGNVYVTGYSSGTGTGWDYATLKYNSSGVEQWISRFNGTGNSGDLATSIALDSQRNVYVTGSSIGSGTFVDYATIKYSSSGVEQWVFRYNGPGNNDDYAYSIAVDGWGNAYVTGGSTGSGTGYDYATIKYSKSVGITTLSNQIPNDFSLHQNYPNPFNPVTKIRFDIRPSDYSKGNGKVKLIVYDILGSEVAVLANDNLNSGTYEIDFDASNYSSGTYYYSLTAGSYKETKKMILIK